MIEARLQARSSSRRLLLATFLSLPKDLRPVRASKEEAEVGTPIDDDVQTFLNEAERDNTGFFLESRLGNYAELTMSLPRSVSFDGLPVAEATSRRNAVAGAEAPVSTMRRLIAA